jgi:bifunctional DNase/RNase
MRMSGRSTGGKLQGMVEVRLSAVRVDLQSNTPVLLLTEAEGLGRTLPIFIGAPEATAIAFAIQGVATPRPMTHDLLRDVIDVLGATLERVVITELRSATYFAELQLKRGGEELSVSSRPSDAVALAVRTESPLYVADELMDAEGILLPTEEDEDGDSGNPDEIVGEFREFLDQVRPEDFSS